MLSLVKKRMNLLNLIFFSDTFLVSASSLEQLYLIYWGECEEPVLPSITQLFLSSVLNFMFRVSTNFLNFPQLQSHRCLWWLLITKKFQHWRSNAFCREVFRADFCLQIVPWCIQECFPFSLQTSVWCPSLFSEVDLWNYRLLWSVEIDILFPLHMRYLRFGSLNHRRSSSWGAPPFPWVLKLEHSEKVFKEGDHLFVFFGWVEVFWEQCSQLTWWRPRGALFKLERFSSSFRLRQ